MPSLSTNITSIGRGIVVQLHLLFGVGSETMSFLHMVDTIKDMILASF